MKTSAKSWYIAASITTVLVVILTGLMNRVTIPTPDWWNVTALPLVHAILNSITAILLITGGIAIKSGRKKLHSTFMKLAFALSSLFLLSYVVYHFTSHHTLFGDLDHNGVLSNEESLKVADTKSRYLLILGSHIILAIVSFPLILFSIIAAVFQQFTLHKRLVKWTYPMWLYVCCTGPIVYILISPYYP